MVENFDVVWIYICINLIQIGFAAIDCTKETATCGAHGVEGYVFCCVYIVSII